MGAQLGRIRDLGVAISHVDSHGHLHKFKPFCAALKEVLPRHGIVACAEFSMSICADPHAEPPLLQLG